MSAALVPLNDFFRTIFIQDVDPVTFAAVPATTGTVTAFLATNPDPSEEEAREAIGGNLCRCTGYQNIVRSVLRAAELLREEGAA